MDFFAGSGTLGEAAALLDRNFILVDNNDEAIRVMAKRLAPYGTKFENCGDILDNNDVLQNMEFNRRLF